VQQGSTRISILISIEKRVENKQYLTSTANDCPNKLWLKLTDGYLMEAPSVSSAGRGATNSLQYASLNQCSPNYDAIVILIATLVSCIRAHASVIPAYAEDGRRARKATMPIMTPARVTILPPAKLSRTSRRRRSSSIEVSFTFSYRRASAGG